ncbi:hypothetical protein HanXRQr2_Chr04g0146361 [Helianthus annuus]|uniref:Uncharacterized protein n=1 Tax=Helianthus annuus TaxID=4232 RepID=A0A9K3NQ46_HELAN|nr:hypothetical protein HanXRQr2_Chr04g0146361 [Helianthus annuus]
MQVKRGLTKSRLECHRKSNAIAGGGALVFKTPSMTLYIRVHNSLISLCFLEPDTAKSYPFTEPNNVNRVRVIWISYFFGSGGIGSGSGFG